MASPVSDVCTTRQVAVVSPQHSGGDTTATWRVVSPQHSGGGGGAAVTGKAVRYTHALTLRG